VTGTRIRRAGSASPVLVTTRRQLEQAGINDLADFSRVLPQNYTGGQNRGIAGGGEQGGQLNLNDSTNLNLRGLGPDATLMLLNGHRLSYDGLNQGVDISAIPLSAIERIEVVADGASALYGSDAVAGVANIILRRDYDGLETTARAGGSTEGGDFQQQYNAVGGHVWSSGGFMLAVDHSRATPITAGQRDYTSIVDRSLFLTSRIRQTSAVIAAHQQISSHVGFELDGTAMDRRSQTQNPFFPDQDVHVSGIVVRPHVRSFSLSPTLHLEVGPWQTSLTGIAANSRTLINGTNYFDSASVEGRLLYADRLKGVEVTAEGPVLALPGGDARLAVGGGARRIALHVRQVLTRGGQSATTENFTERRNVQFAYGELSLPLVSPELGVPLVNSLTMSAALRYEHWNDIATVTTPKLGLVYQPTPDAKIRATWGKSFKIPTLLQVNQVLGGYLLPGFVYVPAPTPPGSTVLLLDGSGPELKPERATTWSGTLELTPRIAPGLDLQATYFHVSYRDRIASPFVSSTTSLFNPIYDDFITYNPSSAEVNALIATLPAGLVNETGLPFDPSNVGAIVDASIRNTERQSIHGVDLSADYRLDLGSGGKLLLNGAASYLKSSQQLTANQQSVPLAGTIFHPPHWRGRAGAVWQSRSAEFSAFVNYVGSTSDNRFSERTRAGSFVTLDLNAGWRPSAGAGPLENVELRLAALNVLNQEPKFIRNTAPEAAPYDSTNQSPVGRFIGASIRKVW
jgi:outer membrane receptor protein involved in Fe transport